MIKWEDYIDKKFMLSSGTASTNFIRSTFDYGKRQRRALKGYDTYSVKVYLEYWETLKFIEFWEDLQEGTDKFYTDIIISGDASINKTVRFTSGYQMQDIGCGIYLLNVPLEKVRTGTPYDEACPLVPSNILIPREGLTPC